MALPTAAIHSHLAKRNRSAFAISVVLLVGVGGIFAGQAQAPLQKIVAREALTSSSATNSDRTPDTPDASGKTLEARLAKARSDLAAAAAQDRVSATNRTAAIALQDVALRRGLLDRLVRLYEQQVSLNVEMEAAKARRAELAQEARSWKGFAGPPPYSILLTDKLREGISLERLQIANDESALSMLTKLIEENHFSLNQAEEKIRQLNEKLEGASNEAAEQDLNWQREMEKLRGQVAGATVAVLDLERQVRQERLAGSKSHLGLLQQQLVMATAGMTFTDADLEKVNGRLDAEKHQLERELTDAETRRVAAAKALDTTREELRRDQGTAETDPSQVLRATEQFELRQTQSETADAAVNALRFMLQVGSVERTIWEMRFASYHSKNAETIHQTERRLEQLGRRVDLWKNYYRQQGETIASQVAQMETRLADLDATPELASLVGERLAALREHDQMLVRVVRSIERSERLVQQLSEGLREATENLPLLGRLNNAFSDTGSLLARLWGLELFVAQDTITVDGQQITGKRSVTLGKIIQAILILVVGYWLAGLLSRFMEPIFIKRFKIERNQANLIRRWLRVVLVLALALFSLVSVKIPLTVFAFAGGALAIGLGFGLQTLLKNFVSGIIILFERPFRVGDVLDVAGQRGTVSSIGIRSSVLQLWDGTETLIPNSTLLENNLTNWTYSTRVVRFTVTVGVAYGSDARRVSQLLSEIADRHGLVEKEPKPQVLFTNFGESSLDFELRFWVNVVKANAAQVASDLRQMIAGTFAEHKIIIAFPQRDLHLDTTRPLQVQILPVADSRPQDSATARAAAAGSEAPDLKAEIPLQPKDSVQTPKLP